MCVKNRAKVLWATLLFAVQFQVSYSIQAQEKYAFTVGRLDSIQSNVLDETRKFWVQLPAYYNPKKTYPVVYVLDGGVHLNAVSVVHSYYSGGFIPEMILVGISNQTHRNRDLTTSTLTEGPQLSYIKASGGAEKFIQFMEEELIPYIETSYPATTYRTLIGHSYGGLFTLNALLNHGDLFANYLAIDPSVDWNQQQLLREAKPKFAQERFDGKAVFISLGGQLHMQDASITLDNVRKDTTEFTRFARSNLAFTEAAKAAKGLRTDWKFYPNDPHGTLALPSIMDGLLTLFDWFPIEHTHKFNNPKTPVADLSALVTARAKKLKEHFGYDVPPFDEELLTMLGYMNMDMEQPAKSLAFFKFTLQYYPTSVNAHEAIADYYSAQKEYKTALSYLKKAYALEKQAHIAKKIDELLLKMN